MYLLDDINRKIKSISCELLFVTSFKKKAYYIGWQGHGNLGDEALFLAFQRLFAKEIKIYNKEYIGRGVKYCLDGSFDYLFLGGGTLINRGESYLYKLKNIKAKKKVVFGTGVADPEFWSRIPGSYSSVTEWMNQLNNFDYIGVRGPLSKKILLDWGVIKDIKIIGDPALYFLNHRIFKKRKKKCLGINIGFLNGKCWGGDDYKFLTELISELRILGKRGWCFKFFPVYSEDVGFISLAVNMLSGFNVKVVKNYLNVNLFMNELQEVDIFIGEKLHSVVIALCAHTPSIMLEYRTKCRDFMMSIEMEHLNIPINAIQRQQLVELVENIYKNVEYEQKIINEKIMSLKNQLSAESKRICNDLV